MARMAADRRAFNLKGHEPLLKEVTAMTGADDGS